MSFHWQTCTLIAFFVALWSGCSGDSKRELPGTSGSAGRAGHAGSAGRGSPPASEGGAAGSDNEGGQSPGITGGAGGTLPGTGGSNVAVGGVGGSAGLGEIGGLGGTAGLGETGGLGGSAGLGGAAMAGSAGTAGASSVPPLGWRCPFTSYGDGTCDCGCGATDRDCKKDEIKRCDVCNGPGSCSGAECPGRIDPDDIAKCLPVPDAWTCLVTAYGDERTCDCGCGAPDPDCGGESVDFCDRCDSAGACSHATCPASVAADDNTSCEIPEDWYCSDYNYGDNFCDCGCGALDIDCDGITADHCETCSGSSCSPFDCDNIVVSDNTQCSSPPYDWYCARRLYNDGARCDCGCGFPDPDCKGHDIGACDSCDAVGSCSRQACPGLIDPEHLSTCTVAVPPPEWTCYAWEYGDGTCTCGCGAPDVDCRGPSIDECEVCPGCGNTCPGRVDPADTTVCLPPPSGWTCDAPQYGDGYACDCGCGIKDPDCPASDFYCILCPEAGCSVGHCDRIDPNDSSQCTLNVPAAWTCDRNYFGDGAVCDCGCGARDQDCRNATVSACNICNSAGSCSTAGCPGKIEPTDNGVCTP